MTPAARSEKVVYPDASRRAKRAQVVPVAVALRRALAKGYHAADLRADVMAGAVVGVVALPLSMALAIAVGAPPERGLYTAIVAGASTALLGGCKFQVTGPTAAFVVILAPIVAKFGLSGLLTAGLMAGVLLVGMGATRMGSLIHFIPYPVTTGFTTGIATVIGVLQLKDVFGLQTGPMPEAFVAKVAALWAARGTARVSELAVAAVTFALLLAIPRVVKRVPAPLLAIALVALGVAAAHAACPDFAVATIGSRFHTTVNGVDVAGIPSVLPKPSLPWGAEGLSFATVRELVPAAFAIAMLGAIESLLSAVIADGMTNTKHDPNAELVALGVGNVLAPIFGGIAATGALARTATNVRAGARSPLAATTHAMVILLAIVALAPLVAYIPMASLAALLLLVAWNMSEARHFVGVVREAPRSDVFVLLTCFFLTVVFDMVVAVTVGVVLAALLFMKRMSELTASRVRLDSLHDDAPVRLPKGVVLYEIDGPLFFGAAQNAMGALDAIHAHDFRVLLLHLGRVPVIDATGLVALEHAVAGVVRRKRHVVITGPLPKPRRVLDRARLEARHRGLRFAGTFEEGLALASELALAPSGSAPPRGH